MAQLDMAAFTAATNKLYPNGLESQLYPQCPLLGWLPKTYTFEGASRQVRPLIGGGHGGATFAKALANKSVPTLKDFTVTRVKDYVIGSVDAEGMMATRSQRGASAQALKTSIDGSTYAFGRSHALQLWGNGGGARGQIDSINASTITLSDANDSVNFEIGATIASAETDGTSGSVQSGSLVVTAVNRRTGVITFDQAVTTGIPSADADDYLFRDGDFGNCITGIRGWVPTSDPTGSLFGVDRTVDTVRLAGIRVTGAGTIEETVFDACGDLAVNGGMADTLWMHPKKVAEMCKSIQAKADYKAGGKAEIGFSGYTFASPTGQVRVMADANCPYAYGLLTRKSAWELAALGQVPHFAKDDGRQFARESTSDGIEYRIRFFGNLICHKPVDCALITWA